ncbi:hypothetical protein C8F04DRAFT_1103073 [Mycena alexandri]|uniref:Secreted protein n=1 Tax=Mycena alexandri TaxID=1745969 RepID=A0AAD6X6M3_9AGAR|nr:hypothetical protein C8F04DRAFT_1103073 [Mycena alexandri]
MRVRGRGGIFVAERVVVAVFLFVLDRRCARAPHRVHPVGGMFVDVGVGGFHDHDPCSPIGIDGDGQTMWSVTCASSLL